MREDVEDSAAVGEALLLGGLRGGAPPSRWAGTVVVASVLVVMPGPAQNSIFSRRVTRSETTDRMRVMKKITTPMAQA